MNEKISIIIPIYKVEKYLKKCIDSVINQSYSNLEIILVDDGSPDNCPKICDEYKEKDERIIVLHKPNGGLSDARNEGMKKATGNYITFIDSDDYVDANYIESLYEIVNEKSEIGIINPKYVNENGEILKKYQDNEELIVYETLEAIKTMLYQKKYDTSAWGKIYKKELWKDIEFPVGELYEDISTIYKVMLKAKRICFKNIHTYYYLQRSDSIMKGNFKIRDMDYIYGSKRMLKDIESLNKDDLTKAAYSRFISANFSILLKLKNNKEYIDEKKYIKNNIKEYSKNMLLNKNVRLKNKIAIVLLYFKLI